MRKGNNLFQSLFLLLFALLLLLTATFAWFSVNIGSEVNPITTQVGEYKVDIKVEINPNNKGFLEVKTEEEMAEVFNNTVPGDKYDFRLSFTNKGTCNVNIAVEFYNIINLPFKDDNINMFDVFLIDGVKLSSLVDESNSWHVANDLPIMTDATEIITFRLEYDENISDIKYQEGKIKINSIIVYINSEDKK